MSDILDLIDGTLEDYSLSDDAMRWTANPEVEQIFPGVVTAPSLRAYIDQLAEDSNTLSARTYYVADEMRVELQRLSDWQRGDR